MNTATKPTKAQERAEAIERLRLMLPPGSTVKTILRHCSRSGMLRAVSPIIEGTDYGWLVARALDLKIDQKHGGCKMGGCGIDMGFELVYHLSATLYREGFGCIGKGETRGATCPSNDHSNGDRDYTPHKPCGLKPQCEHWHKSGGYALRQEWL